MTIRQSIEIESWEHPVESLPKEILKNLSDTEQKAYSEGVTFFKKLANESGFQQIVDWMNQAEDDQPMFVDMLKIDDDPWQVWFGFSFPLASYQPRFLLPRKTALPPNTPPEVQEFYKSFGGLSDPSFLGGFVTPEELSRGASAFAFGEDNHSMFPEGSYPLFNFGNGDFTGWLPDGNGFFFNHETNEIDELSFEDLVTPMIHLLNENESEED